MVRFAWMICAATLLVWAGGCGGPTGGKTADTGVESSLHDLGTVLRLIADQKQKPPAKPADFAQYEPAAPFALAAINAKEIVYLWGQGFAAGGTQVVAHETDADTKGGLVLLQDGTVKSMSADEVKAAKPAKK